MGASRVFLICTLCAVAGPLVLGCEPELGQPCSPDSDLLKAEFSAARPRRGNNVLMRSVAFENCASTYCGATDFSRPFCTKRCESDLDCTGDLVAPAEGFSCEVLVNFGRDACQDWSPETDCQQPDGSFSELPYRYCVTTRRRIEQRDAEIGRAPEDVPVGWICPTSFYETNDGCDCGCGVVDPDCGAEDDSVCEHSWCAETSSAPAAGDNSQCVSVAN